MSIASLILHATESPAVIVVPGSDGDPGPSKVIIHWAQATYAFTTASTTNYLQIWLSDNDQTAIYTMQAKRVTPATAAASRDSIFMDFGEGQLCDFNVIGIKDVYVMTSANGTGASIVSLDVGYSYL